MTAIASSGISFADMSQGAFAIVSYLDMQGTWQADALTVTINLAKVGDAALPDAREPAQCQSDKLKCTTARDAMMAVCASDTACQPSNISCTDGDNSCRIVGAAVTLGDVLDVQMSCVYDSTIQSSGCAHYLPRASNLC